MTGQQKSERKTHVTLKNKKFSEIRDNSQGGLKVGGQ